ncbi:MAG: hypothetical protein MI748_11640 [Opitutales bacterium]|nr:hypothetical protein [Opitutales bacterium]
MNNDLEISEIDIDRVQNVYRFGGEKIYRTWKEVGKKGECSYSISEFDGNHYEYSAFGANTERRVRSIIVTGILGSVLYFGFVEHLVLKILGILFLSLLVILVPTLISMLKTTHWVAFSSHNGDGIISFRIEGLKGITKEELIDKVTIHIQSHNKSAERNSASLRSSP